MTCKSTQPTFNATTQYGTFVLEFISSFAENHCRKGSTMVTQQSYRRSNYICASVV